MEVVEEFVLCRGPDGALCGWELPAAEVNIYFTGLTHDPQVDPAI